MLSRAMIAAAILSQMALAEPGIQSFSAHFPDFSAQDKPVALAADPSGDFFIVSGAAKTPKTTNIHVTKTDPAGNVIAKFDFGGSLIDTLQAAAVDPQGNLIIVGGTQSPDFPLVSPLRTSGAVFVTKLDGQLNGIVFSTLLGGLPGSYATAVAFDSASNIYIGGIGSAIETTPGALEQSPPVLPAGSNGAIIVSPGFVAEISSAGDQLVFSTYFGGAGVTTNIPPFCIQFFLCMPADVYTTPTSIAVDSGGAIIIAGNTDANDLPMTANSFSQQCHCTNSSPGAFVAKIAPGGGRLAWGTYIPFPSGPAGNAQNFGLDIHAIALDSAGDVILAGETPPGFPANTNALQTTLPEQPATAQAGFVAELDATGSRLLFATYFGDDERSSSSNGPVAVGVDASGTIWLAGSSALAAMPAPAGTPLIGTNYIAGISPDGSRVTSFFTAPNDAANASLAVTRQGALAALGVAGELLISATSAAPSLMGIVELDANAVSSSLSGRELISLYGINIGPPDGIVAPLVNDTFGRSLAGYQVLFNGIPAALLYAGPTQINAIVPSAIATARTASIQILTPSGTISGPVLAIQPTHPQVYNDGTSAAFAINQDGTINSPTNRAQPGSIVSIWFTGGGAAADTPDDQINTTLNSNPYPISVLTGATDGGSAPLNVTYAGDAPEMPSGAIQVNFQLAAAAAANGYPLILQVGSQTAAFFVQVVD